MEWGERWVGEREREKEREGEREREICSVFTEQFL